MKTEESVILSEQAKPSAGLLNLFIFTLSLLLFVYSLYLSLVLLDRNILIQNGWSKGLMTYQTFIGGVHAVGLFILIRLLLQRKKIAIAYVKIAIVLGAVFRLVVDPIVAGVIDSSSQVPTFRLWGRVIFGLVFPIFWFQYFRKSEDLRRILDK